MLAHGFTAESHYAQYGLVERTSPNEWFNTNEYLLAKAAQLNAAQGVDTWTADSVAAAFAAAGYTDAYQHFIDWGWKEGVNPSNAFDLSTYLELKAAQSSLTVAELTAALEAAGLDPISHYEEWGQYEGFIADAAVELAVPADEEVFDTSNLTAALATLAAAETAKADFIAAQDLDEDPDTDTAEADITALIDAAAAAGNPVRDFNDDYGTTLGSTSTVNARNAAYAVERAAAEALVLAEEDDVAAAQAAVDALDADAEIAAYQAAKAADDAEALVLLDAQSDLAGAEAYFYTQAGLLNDELVRDAATGAYTYDDDNTGGAAAFDLIVVNGDGDLELATGITEADYPGVTALLAASVALEAAEVAKAATASALATATTNLDAVDAAVNGTELGLVTALATQQGQLEAAQEAAADLEAAIADVEAAYALNAQLDALNDDIADAVTAINNGDWNVVKLDGAANANADAFDNDVFLFNGDAAAITNFGAVGSDLIKFAAETYTLVEVDAADWAGTGAVGSSSALEIFVVDDGTDTFLYVEQNAFDGSTNAAQGNVITIELTGVSDMAASLNSAGYLAVA